MELTATEFEASKYPVKLPFPPIKKVPNAPEYPLFSMLSKWRDAMLKTMTEIVKHEQRWSSNRRPYLFMFLQGNKLVLGPFRNKNMPGIECKFSSLSAKIKLKQIKILTSCHRSASKNPKDLLAGLLFFFFSSNRRSAVLKLYKSWYETLFFADRAAIAAIK